MIKLDYKIVNTFGTKSTGARLYIAVNGVDKTSSSFVFTKYLSTFNFYGTSVNARKLSTTYFFINDTLSITTEANIHL